MILAISGFAEPEETVALLTFEDSGTFAGTPSPDSANLECGGASGEGWEALQELEHLEQVQVEVPQGWHSKPPQISSGPLWLKPHGQRTPKTQVMTSRLLELALAWSPHVTNVHFRFSSPRICTIWRLDVLGVYCFH